MDTGTPYKSVPFFAITLLISWSTWFVSAYYSYQEGMGGLQALFFIPGLFGPLAAALIMIRRSHSPELWKDYRDRLFDLRRIKPAAFPFALLLMPVVMLASIAISLLFGKSADQFAIARQFSFSAGPTPVLLILVFVPALEEMGWRGYGVDSLRSRFNLFATALFFGVLWGLWHLPMFFMQHYYQHELLVSWVYTANFWVSIVALSFIINWLFYRNGRSIIICYLLHLSVDLASEAFQTEQFTKCIGTVLLILTAAVIVIADRKFFFEKTAAA